MINNQEPKVTLLSHTELPLETVYSVWEASKGEAPLRTPEQIRREVPPEEVETLFRAVIAQRIPVGEHVDFVFMLENISVSLREQIVRHRIGTKASPERVGADIVLMDSFPNLADSTFWSQSMRIQDMGKFADRAQYRLPKTVKEAGPDAVRDFQETMQAIQDAYNRLVAAGVPMEDARELMPLGAQHRMSWKLNISALQHIVGKRGCWILQLGIWGPIIQGMVNELVEKVHPVFAELVTPPCLDGDTFTGCKFHEEVRRRYTQDDRLPPCPLHLYHHHSRETAELLNERPEAASSVHLPMAKEMVDRAEDYREFWRRNPYTGIRLPVVR